LGGKKGRRVEHTQKMKGATQRMVRGRKQTPRGKHCYVKREKKKKTSLGKRIGETGRALTKTNRSGLDRKKKG